MNNYWRSLIFVAVALLLTNIGYTMSNVNNGNSLCEPPSNGSVQWQSGFNYSLGLLNGSLNTSDMFDADNLSGIIDFNTLNNATHESIFDEDVLSKLIKNDDKEIAKETQQKSSSENDSKIDDLMMVGEDDYTPKNIAIRTFKQQCDHILDTISSFGEYGLGRKEIFGLKTINDELSEAINNLYDEKGKFKSSLFKSETEVTSIVIRLSKLAYNIDINSNKPAIAAYFWPEYIISINENNIFDLSHRTMTKILNAYLKDNQDLNGIQKKLFKIYQSVYDRFIQYIMQKTKEQQSSIKQSNYKISECESTKTYKPRYSDISDIILSHLFFISLSDNQLSSNDFSMEDIKKHTVERIGQFFVINDFEISHYNEDARCIWFLKSYNVYEIYNNIGIWLKNEMEPDSKMQSMDDLLTETSF